MSSFQKKQEIADAFMEYFRKFGMKKTIVNDVVKSLGMSKKTVYKYFKGGKEEALYYFFRKVADFYVKNLEDDLNSLPTAEKKLVYVLQQIYEISRPHIEANVADEEDYVVENEIVGSAFRDAYQNIVKKLLKIGMKTGEFKNIDVDLTIHLIYGMILESMKIIHQNHKRKIKDDVIDAVMKILQ
ncbi:MAG: TetR/AcrR family transcriptional regulator [Candidatus Lokiarchaeota archaeon]|nr:TetR/AcrR family transcriptional regulator [Candidatus Lokiarchaeota archaeon]